MNKLLFTVLIYLFVLGSAWSHGVAETASASIVSPENGSTVSNPVKVKFAVTHFLIAPTGENIHQAGHYHLLIDLESDLSMDEPIPYDKQHLHFDKGEKETLLTLAPGKHTLQLVVADEEHEPFEQLISPKIIIEVTEKQAR